ncbi:MULTISPECIES: hypothetical protein [Luteibacter]|uniref:hypothetical protein n=1 Tax=Luteibacter TaxID=242605 RepID=UPI00055CFAD1|nr:MULTISPECIES: hypothetical protein [unclassified Luteibacter]
MYVTVDIDPEEVIDAMEASDLRKHGVVRMDALGWDEVAARIRRRDFSGAADAINEIARKTGTYLPSFALADIH